MRLALFLVAGGCMVVEEVKVIAREAPEFPPSGRPVAGLSVGLAAEGRGQFYFKLWNVSGRPLFVSTDPRLFAADRLEISRRREGEAREIVRSPERAIGGNPRCSYRLAPGTALVRPIGLDLALPPGEYTVRWMYWVEGEGVWTGLARSNALALRYHGGI